MSSEILTASGSLTIREKIAVPPGAVATVKLVDAAGEVLAAAAFPADGVPVEYSLTADPALTPTRGDLFVWAVLRTDVGAWGTLDLAPAGAGEIVLSRVPD